MPSDLFGEKPKPFCVVHPTRKTKIPRAPMPKREVPAKTWTVEEREHAAKVRVRQIRDFIEFATEELAKWKKRLPPEQYAVMRDGVRQRIRQLRGETKDEVRS